MTTPALSLLLLLAAAPEPETRPTLLRELVAEFETGPGYIFQNDNAYGENGTLYTARESGQQRNLFIGKRIAVEAGLGDRHTLIFLYAPLDLTTRFTAARELNFNDVIFRPGEVIDHRYLFDGYRASYLYRVWQPAKLQWDAGASIQIRNASVEMRSVDENDSRFAVENDIGTVFALKTRLRYEPSEKLWAMFEADVISSFGVFQTFSGGLYDLGLTLGVPVTRSVDAFVRLRWLGGGADVPKRGVYSWGNFFFATAGARGDLVTLFD